MNRHWSGADIAEAIELTYASTDTDGSIPPASANQSRTSLPSHHESQPLLNQGDIKDAAPQRRQTSNPTHRTRLAVAIDNSLRILGLQIIPWALQSFLHASQREPRRVAIVAGRPAVVLASLLHVVPMGACVVLIALTRNEYYISGELAGVVGQDALKFLGLQLAAKLHEITMVASLAEMIVSSIRREIHAGRSIPFAALAAGLQFNSISYLWSRDFMAICLNGFTQNWRALPIAVLIIMCSVLGVIVAAASATAMQPVLSYWPAGGTDVWLNGSIESLYPTTVDASHVAAPECLVAGRNPLCPSGGWETLGTNMLSFSPDFKPVLIIWA
ncbi:hypothetical protein LTR64_002083 [Lithohypha guttulata]|uniref:uncharacterized protein n=1 Tax=Lithohypha guttulata TaxID=1690604 RepID=UPI002DE17E33|nr:hypothetical protein LTR51_007941 [Lithohypha guttulata]